MTSARPPAPPPPAVGPATCAAASDLAITAAQLIRTVRQASNGPGREPSDVAYTPTPEERAEAARMLRAAADLVAPPAPAGPRPPVHRDLLDEEMPTGQEFLRRFHTPSLVSAETGRPAASKVAANPAAAGVHEVTSNSAKDGPDSSPPGPAPRLRTAPSPADVAAQLGRRIAQRRRP